MISFTSCQTKCMTHVRKVLAQLLENQLFVKGWNEKFHIAVISFLGYIINEEGVLMDQDKVTTVKELLNFLGFFQFFCSFIWGFSSNSLTALLMKVPKKLQWNPLADQALKCLKEVFTSDHLITWAHSSPANATWPPANQAPKKHQLHQGKYWWLTCSPISKSLLLHRICVASTRYPGSYLWANSF